MWCLGPGRAVLLGALRQRPGKIDDVKPARFQILNQKMIELAAPALRGRVVGLLEDLGRVRKYRDNRSHAACVVAGANVFEELRRQCDRILLRSAGGSESGVAGAGGERPEAPASVASVLPDRRRISAKVGMIFWL